MNHMKKIASLMLALAILFSLAMPALAAEEKYTIEVTNTNDSISINGIAYSAYKLFNVSYSGDAYSYTVTEEFQEFSYNEQTGDDLISYIATLQDNAEELNKFAEAALTYAKTTNISAAATATATNEKATIDVTTTGAGYYLIAGTASAGENQTVTAACSLDTTNPTAKVNVKADAPTIDKVIVDADDTKNGTSVNVGDAVNFKLTSKVPSMIGYETYQYIVHDTMSNGLTFNNDITVKIGNATLTKDTDYTVKTDDSSTETFTITIADLTKYTTDDSIEITYSATLNENALNTDVETNKVNLEYSNNPHESTDTSPSTAKTPDDAVYVYDFDINVDKYAKDETEDTTDNTRLADASFLLYKKVDNASKYYKLVDKKVTWVDAENDATIFSTDANGKASFPGLEAGTYYLHETKAPAGYNALKEDIEVTITATYKEDGTLATTNTTKTDNGQYGLTQGVENSTGSELPSTGGMGTTLFYTIGGLLMLAAVVLLVVKKRMGSAE